MAIIEFNMTDLFTIIGQLVIIIFITVFFVSILASILIVYSFKTSHFLFPNFMLSIIILLEGVVKSIFRMVGLDDSIVDQMAIQLKNRVSMGQFKNIPYTQRMVFFPQCLRNIDCPAKLTPEGIQCINCGMCEIGNAKQTAEALGYKVFIVPGSSFIKRMVKKYRPRAIVGVGCMFEVKSGLDLCSNIGVIGVGMELEKSGCVATELEWNDFYTTIRDEKK